jgi:chromosome segregation ATPase
MSKAVIDAALAHIKALADTYAEIADIEEHAARAKADLDSVNRTLAERKAQLAGAESEFARANAAAHKAHEQTMFEKRGELRDLAERVERLREEQATLTDGNRKSEMQLRNFESAIEEAKRRLN